jgi:GT2 family glycosyltransferase
VTKADSVAGETPDVLVVTAQYGNIDDTTSLVASLAQLERPPTLSLIVVDNSREDGLAGIGNLAGSVSFPLKCVRPGSNLYYWGGAAYALEPFMRNPGSLPRWVMICNNDIVIPDPGFLSRLVSLDPAEYPIIAPEIVSHSTGKRQNPLLDSPPTFRQRLKWWVYDRGFPIATAMLRVHRRFHDMVPPRGNPRQNLQERDIYAPHGACVILSSAFFERGGSLDTSVPMFAEELTLAATAARLGMAVRYVPSLRVVHREHSTTGPHLTREKYRMERSARRRYYSIVARRR